MMIKPKISLLAVAMAAALLSGCSQEETQGDDSNYPLELQASFADAGSRASATLQTDKVDYSVTLGVFAWDNNGNAIGTNVPYTYDASTAKWKVKSGTQGVFFPMDGTPIRVTAYSPYDPSITSEAGIPTVLTPKSDQSAAADYLACDLIRGEKSDVAYSATTVNLTMRHLMSRITVQLLPGGGLKNSDFPGATIEVAGITSTVPDNESAASVIVQPGSIAAGEIIKIKLAALTEYRFSIPQSLTLASGDECRFSLTLQGTELILDQTSLTNWSVSSTNDNNSTMMPNGE